LDADGRPSFSRMFKVSTTTNPMIVYCLGQLSSVRLEDFYVRHVAASFIFGSFNQFNEEKTGGPPCGKVAVGHALEHRRSGEWFVIVNVHGFGHDLASTTCQAGSFRMQGYSNSYLSYSDTLQPTHTSSSSVI
jgi:hypothetical protein